MPTTQDIPPDVIRKQNIHPPPTRDTDEERRERLGVERHSDQQLGNELDNRVDKNIGLNSDEPRKV